ncbi:MAG TPA: NAD(P)-dependent oxidoreductase [Gemmataceae bacterium]|nr:NAD(P)-dependent oxidoreductase [Gemmataceae bacterium]
MNASPIVLVTGSAGRIGRAVVAELQAQGRTVRGFDRVPTPGVADGIVGDLTDAAAVRRAVEGVGTVIHLAAIPDDDDFLTQLAPNNIIGVYHVLESARLAGVRRLILASSGQVVWWQRQHGPWPIKADDPPTPRGWYAAAKVFLEAAGRMCAESHGMSVLAVRLGWVPRSREHVEELAALDWAKDVYLSPGDAGRFFACAVDAPADIKFAIVYATSRPREHSMYDLDYAKKLLGFEPRDRWPEGIEDMGAIGRSAEG